MTLDKEALPKAEVEQLIQGLTLTTSWLLDNSQRSSIPTSLISEMLVYGPGESLDVSNIFRAGRWNIPLYGAAVPISASAQTANQLCSNQFVWERYDERTVESMVREQVEEGKWSEIYSVPDGISVKKLSGGVRVSVPGFPPEGTRICVVDFVMSKGRVIKVHQDWDFDYEEKRPAFGSGVELPFWKLLRLNVALRSLAQ